MFLIVLVNNNNPVLNVKCVISARKLNYKNNVHTYNIWFNLSQKLTFNVEMWLK